MLTKRSQIAFREAGVSMIEVLITAVILAFGLLGLATLQAKIHVSEMESYQRAQAVVLVNDMVERISANRNNAASYVSGNSIGTGDAQPTSCSAVAVGVNRDTCEWSNALKGAAEKSSGNNVGAMIGAHGCITQIQAPDPTAGICAAGIYQITVTWQGLNATVAPSSVCPNDVAAATLRSLSSAVAIGLPTCS